MPRCFALLACFLAASSAAYDPTWESLDQRTAPEWFLQEKFYIFVHWGLFSVPHYAPLGKLAEWYKQELMQPDMARGNTSAAAFHARVYGDATCTSTNCSGYDSFKHQFRAELWDPNDWVALFQRAGARGLMFTTKHCDGYTHWKSPAKPGYNSVDAGPRRDVVADLTKAVRKTNMRLGFYYCDCEWGQNDATTPWPFPLSQPSTDQLLEYSRKIWLPDMRHLATEYEPDFYFPDFGGACGFNSTTLRARDFLAWLYTNSSIKDKVVVGDRLGSDANCKHGDYFTCRDRYQPQSVQNHLWMDCMTIGQSWGYDRLEQACKYNATGQQIDPPLARFADGKLRAEPDACYRSATSLIHILIDNVAYGGVLTLNVGPAADGTIVAAQAERLISMGDWLKVNGDAIYQTTPWRVQHAQVHTPRAGAPPQPSTIDVYYTAKQGAVFALLTAWPAVDATTNTTVVELTDPTIPASETARAALLGREDLQLTAAALGDGGGVRIEFPPALGPESLPCDSAWVIKLTGVE